MMMSIIFSQYSTNISASADLSPTYHHIGRSALRLLNTKLFLLKHLTVLDYDIRIG